MGNSAKLSVPYVHAPWLLGIEAGVVAQDLLSNVNGCVSICSSPLKGGILSQLISKLIPSPGLSGM